MLIQTHLGSKNQKVILLQILMTYNTHIPLLRMLNGATALENGLVIPQTIK